jgi:large subunit ribosomal protein L15
MPLQRRLPKVGFTSRTKKYTAVVRLNELDQLTVDTVDLQVLIAENVVPIFTKKVKVILSGELSRPVIIKGLSTTVGARNAIEVAGGKVEA